MSSIPTNLHNLLNHSGSIRTIIGHTDTSHYTPHPSEPLWCDGDYALRAIPTINELIHTLRSANLLTKTPIRFDPFDSHLDTPTPSQSAYFALHAFFTFTHNDLTVAILTVDMQRCLRVRTPDKLLPDHPHLAGLCKAITHLRANPSLTPHHTIHYLVGLPAPYRTSHVLLDDGQQVPAAEAPCERILYGRVRAVDLPADLAYALLANPNMAVDITGADKQFIVNLPRDIPGALVMGRTAVDSIDHVQSLGRLYLEAEAKGVFPNLASLGCLVCNDEPDIIDLPCVTQLDHCENKTFMPTLKLPALTAVGVLLVDTSEFNCPLLTSIDYADLNAGYIFLPELAFAGILKVGRTTTLILPKLITVTELTLQHTNLIAPRLEHVSNWTTPYAVDLLVAAPTYTHPVDPRFPILHFS